MKNREIIFIETTLLKQDKTIRKLQNVLNEIKKECKKTIRTNYQLDKQLVEGMKIEAKEILRIMEEL